MRKLLTLTALVFCLATAVAQAANTQVQLLLSAGTAKAGDTVLAGVRLTMAPGWHTYWKNPGAAGKATEIKWQLPPGVTAGDIQWPLPKKLPPLEVTTYAYEEEVVLLVPLKLDSSLSPGPLNLAAKVSWLECKDSCIPAAGDAQASLDIGPETKASSDAITLEAWQAKVPVTAKTFNAQALWQKPAGGDDRPLLFELDWPAPGDTPTHTTADFFPAASDSFEIEADVTNVLNSANEIEFTKPVKKFSGDWPKEVSGVLVLDDKAYELEMPVTDMSAVVPGGTIAATPPPPPVSLWQMLLYAFIGGLILNIMPCVLPVIALKILGFVSEAKNNAAHVRKLGLIYTAGVLLSFLALAALVISVKLAGHKAGWGMQFGSPIFLVCLTTLVTLVALNLFGVFEVTLGGGTLDKAGDLASRPGAAGAFFNGILATILATPCTAPFLGVALGFAFTQPSSILVLMFLAVGTGLAAPYLLLSLNPAWLKFLPKPGVWMEKFKIAMGFPMLATVVWLLSIASSSYGKNVVWLGVFLVFVATAMWVFGEFAQRGRKNKGIAALVALGIFICGYVFALENQLHWRKPEVSGEAGIENTATSNGLWAAWSPEAVTAARVSGKPVIVDFTADWCLTCRVNKQTSIDIDSVSNKLKAIGAVAFNGDYTHFPDSITAELNRYNRAGVPLVLVYPADTNAPPIVLPEVLTPGIVMEALNKVTK
ncbi:MAG: protein-disulfide reductase DsbD family protein [Verrucomicrobiae bacterium]|nr:protein-disulfide reductase DsbD family protein [Verrucomicrobiae bacterium]